MRVLITGATGFIGAKLAAKLNKASHEVYALVRNAERRVELCTPVVWDLGRKGRPASLPTRLDAIVHGSQSRNYRDFPADAPEMVEVNVCGTAALLDYAASIKVGRFCLISSGTVYEPYLGELHEDAALHPTSLLGATKLAAEILAAPYAELFPLAALRLFFPYGPGQNDRLIPQLIQRVRAGRPIQLSRDGEGLRLVPTFVDDIADVIICALAEAWNGTFNVATPAVVSISKLSALIGEVVGTRPRFEVIARDFPSVVPRLDRLRERFDCSRFTTLEEGIRQTIAGQPDS